MIRNLITPPIRGCISATIIAIAISSLASGKTSSTATIVKTTDPKVAALAREGQAALKSKQYGEAISRFTAALEMRPDKHTASVIYALRAYAYIDRQEPDKAMRDVSESIRLDPRFFGGYLYRGILYRLTGKIDEAINDYNIVLRLNPKFGLAYYNRALAYGFKGENERAIRDYDEALRRDPTNADACYNRAVNYHLIGNLDKAIAGYTEAIRLDRRDPAGYAGRARAYEDLNQLDKARADYHRAVECIAKDPISHLVRGDAYFATGDYKRAASEFVKANHLAPNDINALNGLAWFQATCPDASLRNGEEAVRESMKVCELTNWKNAGCLDTLAAAYAETGDFERAVKHQMEATNMNGLSASQRSRMEERLALYRQRKPYRKQLKLTTQ